MLFMYLGLVTETTYIIIHMHTHPTNPRTYGIACTQFSTDLQLHIYVCKYVMQFFKTLM